MVVKIYISGISGNKEVKKRQQRVVMILESKHIGYEVVDITEPGNEAEKDFMQTKSTSLGVTVSDLNPRHALPPQIFNDEEYCGDYDQFDMANEVDELEIFLKVSDVKIEHSIIGNGTIEPVKQPVEKETIENIINENETIDNEKNEEEAVEEVEDVEEEKEDIDNNDTNETEELEVEADVAA